MGNVKRGHISGVCERFDYFTTGESIAYERKVAGEKFFVFLAILSILVVFTG